VRQVIRWQYFSENKSVEMETQQAQTGYQNTALDKRENTHYKSVWPIKKMNERYLFVNPTSQ